MEIYYISIKERYAEDWFYRPQWSFTWFTTQNQTLWAVFLRYWIGNDTPIMDERLTYHITNLATSQNSIQSFPKSLVWRCSVKTVFLKFLQNSQKYTSVGVNKVAFQEPINLLRRDFSTDLFLWICAIFKMSFLWSTSLATSGFYKFCKLIFKSLFG